MTGSLARRTRWWCFRPISVVRPMNPESSSRTVCASRTSCNRSLRRCCGRVTRKMPVRTERLRLPVALNVSLNGRKVDISSLAAARTCSGIVSCSLSR